MNRNQDVSRADLAISGDSDFAELQEEARDLEQRAEAFKAKARELAHRDDEKNAAFYSSLYEKNADEGWKGPHDPYAEVIDNPLDAIPDDQRERLAKGAQRVIAGSLINAPASVAQIAASECWLRTSAALQTRRMRHRGDEGPTLEKLERALGGVSKAAYAEVSDDTGGYLVPDIIGGMVLRQILDSGVVTSRCRRIPMTSNKLELPSEATGITTYWVNEAATLTGGENTLGLVTLHAKKIAGRATASIEAVEDSVIGFLPYVQSIMAEKIGRELDSELLEGTGTNFTGVNAESGVNAVYANSSSTGGALTYGKLVEAMFAAGESSALEGAVVFAKPIGFREAVELTDSSGQPIFQYSNVPGAPTRSILGMPVVLSNAISTSSLGGVVGTNFYIFNPMNVLLGGKR